MLSVSYAATTANDACPMGPLAHRATSQLSLAPREPKINTLLARRGSGQTEIFSESCSRLMRRQPQSGTIRSVRHRGAKCLSRGPYLRRHKGLDHEDAENRGGGKDRLGPGLSDPRDPAASVLSLGVPSWT